MYVSYQQYTTQLKAQAIREVKCENCQAEFFYFLERSATGQGTSFYGLDKEGARERSKQRAADRLQHNLEKAFELVPCPRCFVYQTEMANFLKRSHLMWLNLLGIGMITVGLLILLSFCFINNDEKENQSTAILVRLGFFVLMVTVGIALIFVRQGFANSHNPNLSDINARKKLALERAMLKADLQPGKGPGD